jgi:hypothetical protein
VSAISDASPTDTVVPPEDERDAVHICPEPVKATEPTDSLGSACFSSDKRFLYQITRSCGGVKNVVTFILLNPGIGTSELTLDHNLRKCLQFIKRLGLSEMRVVYAFPIVGPDQLMLKVNDREGAPGLNDSHIECAVADASLVIAGWGPALGKVENWKRFTKLRSMLSHINVLALSVTDNGQPWSPLLVQEPKLAPYDWEAARDPFVKTAGAA